MKVILNQTVPKVGKHGSVVNVADGYARNYLFPRGLAVIADKNQLNALDRKLARLDAKTADEKAAAETLKEQLSGKTVRIEGKVGKDTGKLFGAITAQDVADAIKSQLGTALEKKQIAMIEPIKRLGTHQVELDLHRTVDVIVNVVIFDPTAPVEEPAAETTVETQEELGEEELVAAEV